MRWKKDLWPEWQIECDIGAGAYGTVYKIKRQDIGGTYYAALKVISFPHSKKEIENLRNKKMSDEQISEYFNGIACEIFREFALMERLKGHTNIVSYEDHKIISRDNGLYWDVLIRMELLTPLTEYLKKRSLDEYDVCKFGIDICNALILCEKEGIVHRDIKPGNIFVSDFGDFKLGDFSLAKYSEIYSIGSSPQGTYSYMAPEVYKGFGYDFTIDIYSLGLILYRLLNRGRAPFQPFPPVELSLEVLEQANKKRFYADVLPKPCDASTLMANIIQKACSYNPEKRYENAAEMKKALERCQVAQSTLKAKRQVSDLVRKAVNAIAGFEDEEVFIKINEGSEKKNNEDVKVEGSNSVNNELNKVNDCKTMSDFFSTAGDL